MPIDDAPPEQTSVSSLQLMYFGGSSARLTLRTLRCIAALAEAGATIAGVAPLTSPGRDDTIAFTALERHLWSSEAETRVGRGRVIAGRDVAAALRIGGVAPDFSGQAPTIAGPVMFVHRQLDAGHVYFLSSRADAPSAITGRSRVIGYVPEVCFADTGRCEAATYHHEGDRTIVTQPFDISESFFVLFRQRSDAAAFTAKTRDFAAQIALAGPWRVNLQPARGASKSIDLLRLASLRV